MENDLALEFQEERLELVTLLRNGGIHNEATLRAIQTVPRHLFVPKNLQRYSYQDVALPIGSEQTISQPFVVARMTEVILEHKEKLHKVLEVGTGSGYQAAILSQVADAVYTIERINDLWLRSTKLLKKLGCKNVHTLHADGYLGWEEHSPYEAIIVTAAASEVPEALLQQLADGGLMVIPVNSADGWQDLRFIVRDGEKYYTHFLDPVMFVPLRHGVM